MINFRVGIMGAGNIADTVADTLNKVDGLEPYAIASRDMAKACEFGDKHNIEKRYGSYEELVADPDVELIYIATPHSLHAEQAKMCINAGKPVLVEKAFSYNAKTAIEVFNLAKEKHVFCCEAMWIRFMPIYHIVKDAINKNLIGNVTSLTCSLGYDLRGKERLVKPELAGGVLLDLGVYPLHLAALVFGKNPDAIASTCARLETGVDAVDTIQLNYKGGQNAAITISMTYKCDNSAKIYGTTGYIEIDNINNPTSVRIFRGDNQLAANVTVPEKQINGYEYEFITARNEIIL
ncbi:MAG: Gfo/Idh/MocA family protein, partial [Wujia sp.]